MHEDGVLVSCGALVSDTLALLHLNRATRAALPRKSTSSVRAWSVEVSACIGILFFFLLWTRAYTLLDYSSHLFIPLRNSYSSVTRDQIFPQFILSPKD